MIGFNVRLHALPLYGMDLPIHVTLKEMEKEFA